ncbi:MAG: hypothetical protein PHE36_08590 [Novosphingobium sp.]|nr:hypothetical protein [Novosphingobium sp.]
MRADAKACDTLLTLARLQGLRVAESELALADARDKRQSASAQEEAARDALLRQEAGLAELLASNTFDPTAFAAKGGLVVGHAEAAGRTRAEAESATSEERDREDRWQASRYQEDWLHARHRETARRLRRRGEEKAAIEAASLSAIWSGNLLP